MVSGPFLPNALGSCSISTLAITAQSNAPCAGSRDDRVGLEFAHETRLDCEPSDSGCDRPSPRSSQSTFPHISISPTAAEVERPSTPSRKPDHEHRDGTAPPADLERDASPRFPEQRRFASATSPSTGRDDRVRAPRSASAPSPCSISARQRTLSSHGPLGVAATRSVFASILLSTCITRRLRARTVAPSNWTPPSLSRNAGTVVRPGSLVPLSIWPASATSSLASSSTRRCERKSTPILSLAIRRQPGERSSKATSRLLSLGTIAQRMFQRLTALECQRASPWVMRVMPTTSSSPYMSPRPSM